MRMFWWVAVLGMGACTRELAPDGDTDSGCLPDADVRAEFQLVADPATGEAVPKDGPLPDASLLALKVVDWGDARQIAVAVSPDHITTLVPGADQAGYRPGLTTMSGTGWRTVSAGPRPPTLALLGTCPP